MIAPVYIQLECAKLFITLSQNITATINKASQKNFGGIWILILRQIGTNYKQGCRMLGAVNELVHHTEIAIMGSGSPK